MIESHLNVLKFRNKMVTKCIVVYTVVAEGLPPVWSIEALNDEAYICYGKRGRRF